MKKTAIVALALVSSLAAGTASAKNLPRLPSFGANNSAFAGAVGNGNVTQSVSNSASINQLAIGNAGYVVQAAGIQQAGPINIPINSSIGGAVNP